MARHIRFDLSYDGTDFSGWQQQANARTVQGELEVALERCIGTRLSILGASRTDAGVHALGQVCSIIYDGNLPTKALQLGMNAMLPKDVRILSVNESPLPFNARKQAQFKTYDYYFALSTPETPGTPIPGRYCWLLPDHYIEKFNADYLQQALTFLVGKHDFTSFCAAGSDVISKKRTIFEANLVPFTTAHPIFQNLQVYAIRIRGDGFLKQMVRNIVGTVLEVARTKMALENIPKILAAKDRSAAGPTAPPHGLFLMRVDY